MSDLPPIPRPLTRGSVPPDFKVFEENPYGNLLKIKPGPKEILEEHPEKVRKTTRRVGSRTSSSSSVRSRKQAMGDMPDDIGTDPDSDYDTDLEEELTTRRKKLTKYATESANEHLYETYEKECKKIKVVACSSLLKRGGLELTTIDFSNRSLGPRPIVALARALTNNAKVTHLNVSGNAIGWAGSKAIFDMMRDNYFLTSLNISNNELKYQVFDYFINSLQENSNTLTHLYLNNCCLDDASLEKVCGIMNEARLQVLDLGQNEFGFDSFVAKSFQQAIEDSAALTDLNLSNNRFTPASTITIFEGLTSNIFIQKIDFSWNGIGNKECQTEKMFKAIEKFLVGNDVVEELNISYNNIQDLENQADKPPVCDPLTILGNGLKQNKTLKKLDMSGNSIHSHKTKKGVLKLLEALVEVPDTGLTELKFDKVWVGLEFQKFIEENKETLEKIRIITGEVAAQPKKKAPPKVDPMTKLKEGLEANGMTLNSFFVALDDDDSMTLNYDEFKDGLHKFKIPLSDDEITELIQMLDLDGDGDINYAELEKRL